MRSRILIDTGPLVCLFDRQEEHFELCSEQAKMLPGRLYTCLPVITEAAYLLNRHDSRLADMLLAACRDRVYQILPIKASDFEAIDFADAALMHLANREGIGLIFTLDRRDFGVFRSKDGSALEILPK